MSFTMKKEIIIIGAGGHARSITESVIANGYNIKYYFDKYTYDKFLFGYPINSNLNISKSYKTNVLIAIANNYIREKIYKELKIEYKNISFPNIIDPSAKISNFSNIGKGNMIMSNAFIGSNTKVMNFCIVNNNVSIDHDCVLSNFSSLAPSVTTGGNVQLGLRSSVGIGAIVKNNISIGNDTVIGASSYLNINANKSSVFYGIPAKFIRKISEKDKKI